MDGRREPRRGHGEVLRGEVAWRRGRVRGPHAAWQGGGRRFLKFGVLQFFSWQRARVALPTVYERALDRVRIMDRTGYDAVWLAEHHFSTYSVCPSVHLMGMHVAGMTENLRIGTGVSLAAMYHPTRLAE
ncbi:MAG: LLM class flavin-dependent oxidoreductase, partial [Gammaproteobacteria bacterium]|nr:LLM class flavin-dependent oxidoreductase [Gammaproteobacteria bacterium]